MVRKLLFGLTLLSAFMVNAQDFTFSVDGSDVSGTTLNIAVDEVDYTGKYTGSLHLIVNNNSGSEKIFIFVRHNIEKDGLTGHELCDNQQCMTSPSEGDHVLYSPNGKSVAASGTFFWDIHARFGAELVDAHSTELYTVYELGNETNKVEVTVNYVMSATAVNDISFNLGVSKPYPNPANETVNFNYNLTANGYITIHDVTGKQIANVELVQGFEKTSFNTSVLNNGIYFYNVYVDGVKTSTDKFIVRH